MPNGKKPRKADIERLHRVLDRWAKEEQRMQRLYGPTVKGSLRSTQIKDGEALRRVLEHVSGVKEDQRG